MEEPPEAALLGFCSITHFSEISLSLETVLCAVRSRVSRRILVALPPFMRDEPVSPSG